MKYMLLFLFTLLLHQSLYANIDERKIDVYFARSHAWLGSVYLSSYFILYCSYCMHSQA
jgi:hypothetical protein